MRITQTGGGGAIPSGIMQMMMQDMMRDMGGPG